MADVDRKERIAKVIAAWKEYRALLESSQDHEFNFGVVISRDGQRANDLALRFAEAEVLGGA